jgi:predicted metal-dependent hydrolase
MAEQPSRQLELPLGLRPGEVVSYGHTALDGKLVSFRIKRSPRRRAISLVVDEDGLRVSAPWRSSQRAIETLLQKHAAWVLAKLAHWVERRAAPRRWTDGETIMYRGRPLCLALTNAAGIHWEGATLQVGIPSGRPASVEERVTQWLRDEALACFVDRVEFYRVELGVDAPAIRLSNARTRWGSCHIGGRIHLNWRLIQMPERLIDYVVAHEVAHLREMNHSRRFWRIVEALVPDCAALRAEIRREGHRYLLV